MIYNVDNYGALGDGIHNDTAAIQSAIDDCHKNGGGRVILNGGKTYRSGTLILPSYTELHLETGAVLKGSDNLEDYNVLGLIDGSFYPRVPLVFMEHVRHLTLSGITLARSAFWTTHLVGCEDVLISGIRILNNLRMANCDGIDPDHCKNVRITNCHIECADDCIVFKNTAAAMQYGACENIIVDNCTLHR